MKLTKRNGIFVLDYRDQLGRRQRKSLGTRDRDEAMRQAHALMTGQDSRSDVWTLRKALDHTFSTVWQDQKSWRSRLSIVEQVKAEIGHYLITELTYQLLSEYVGRLRSEGRKPATVNRRLATISKALTEACKLGKLAAVPPIPLQPENNKRTRWLTEEEEQRLLARTDILVERDARQLRALIVFLIDTGARLGEALKLQPEHIGPGGLDVLFLDTKSQVDKPKHRKVPLTNRATAAGRDVAMANRLGTMLTESQLHKRLERVLQASGLAGVTFHTLRHTCASRLLQRGAKLHEVREWLGHSSVTVTERYAHLADSSLAHLTGLLDVTHRCGVSTAGHSGSNVTHFRARKSR